jgi:sulfite reductase beta subunit-like hemoprotein
MTETATDRDGAAAGGASARAGLKEAPTLELVLKRNGVERLKREKSPLGMLDELPQLIAAGYADVPEEDIVRLKWWGLYHDKPKVGTFMLRIKLAAGRLTAQQLQAIGRLSIEHGKGEAELTTRQNVQLHYLKLAELPQVFEKLHAAGLTSLGGCGDAVRAITGCPVAGIAHDELFDATPVVEEAHAFFTGHPDYVDLPRKHKIAIGACADRCFAPEINCIALVGVLRDGEPGFGVLVGGGLSSVPRIGRDLGVFVRPDEAIPVLRALLDAWREDLRYRVSRVKSRMKFMVDDYGPEGMRAEVERRLGYALPDFPLPPFDHSFADHVGVLPQKQEDLVAIGIPVHLGLVSGPQLVAIGELLETLGGEARVTRQQNLVLASLPRATVEETVARLTELGLPLDTNPIRGGSIACTGEPHCNFSVTETKTRLRSLIDTLEERFGDDVGGLRLHLDGCPHACAQHWVGDLGFQGTTARDDEGKRHQAFDIYLRGALGPRAAIGRPVFRRVRSEELDDLVGRLVSGWLEQRGNGEDFRSFCDRIDDEALGALAGREPAKSRAQREEAEAA